MARGKENVANVIDRCYQNLVINSTPERGDELSSTTPEEIGERRPVS